MYRILILAFVTGLFAFQLGCASNSKSEPTTPEPAPIAPPNAPSPGASVDPGGGPATQQESMVLKTSVPLPTRVVNPAPIHPGLRTGVAPEVALRYLRNGNIRFRKARLRNDGQSPKDLKRVADSQKPHAIILADSDSRVPPEIIFDQKLGEVFVIRTAGLSLGREVLASIEYAVEHFGARLILVLGNTSSGAVHMTSDEVLGKPHTHLKAALGQSENIQALVHNIRPRIEQTVQTNPSKNLANEGWANVRGAAREIFQLSPYLQEALRAERIKVVGALYDLETGAVDFK